MIPAVISACSRDELSGRYYAKLYLFPASSPLRKTYTESRKLALRYVAEKDVYLETRKQLERYLLFPLSYGKKEKALLDEAAPGAFRMARLHYRSGKVYLAISVAAECKTPLPPQTYLGAARGINAPIHMTVTGLEADVQKTIALTEPSLPQTPSSRLHTLANRIVEAALENRSQILLKGRAMTPITESSSRFFPIKPTAAGLPARYRSVP
jgi:putative transposase